MKRQRRVGLFIAFLALASVISGWLVAPKMMASLPSQVQNRLPEALYAVIHTPLPRALPAPLQLPNPSSPPIITATAISDHPNLAINLIDPANFEITTTVVSVNASSQERLPTPQPLREGQDLQISVPAAAHIPGLEIVAQKFNNCGPANLSMVLDYYGQEYDQLEIGDSLKPNYEDRNVSPHELVAYVLENSSLLASAYHGGDIMILKRLLAAGFPVIIEKGLWLDVKDGWMGHYLTLIGYDDEQQSFLSLDTFLGPWDGKGLVVSYEEVSEKWHQFNNMFIVVRPQEKEELFQTLMANEMLDPAQMWRRAVYNAQVLLEEDDEDAYSWFNLGASLTHLGELTGDVDQFYSAAIAFDRAREIGLPWRMLWYQFEPYRAYLVAGRIADVKLLTEVILIYEGGRNIEETYLYRGHALLAQGDRDGAEQVYKRALRLNPSMTLAQEALDLLD